MKTLAISELREALRETFGAAKHAGERFSITSYGRVTGAVIGPEDFELLLALEDRADLDLIRAALAESDERIPFDDLRKDLGL